MVWDIPVPTHDYTFRLYQRNLPRRTVRDRAGPTAGQKDSKHGCPTPSSISERRDYLGQGPRRNPWKREGGRTGRDGSRENSLVPVYLPLAHLKLRISEKFQKSKQEWNDDPHHHGTEEIPPPPPKKVMYRSDQKYHCSDGGPD
jgi:hypothetical protein